MWLWFLVYGCAECVYGLYIRDIDETGPAAAVIGIIWAAVGILFTVLHFKSLSHAKQTPYTIRHFEVQDKRIVKDSDDDKKYEVLMVSEGRSNWDTVSKETYSLMQEGEKLAYIYAPNPTLRYRYDADNRSYWCI